MCLNVQQRHAEEMGPLGLRKEQEAGEEPGVPNRGVGNFSALQARLDGVAFLRREGQF